MKTIKRLFLQTVFAIALLGSIVACERDCVPKETIIENKLTPEVLSFFPYDTLNIINCIIDSQQTMMLRFYEKEEGINRQTNGIYNDCGPREVYENQFRIIKYYDQNSKLVLWVKMELVNRGYLPLNDTYMRITFDFNQQPLLRGDHKIGISRDDIQDTLTLGGKFYDDVYTYEDSSNAYALYYSKSKGLIKIKSESKLLFQLVR